MISLLDYGAGNVRSVVNALERLGETVKTVSCGEDIVRAERLVFPGVGSFGSMMQMLRQKQFIEPLKDHLRAGKPFFGICLGLQALFEWSEEAPDIPGLAVLPGTVKRFSVDLAVPHIGWNGVKVRQPSRLFHNLRGNEKFYFVHSYHVVPAAEDAVLTTTDYGCEFVSAVQLGNIIATQFHPEKSGAAGLALLENFLAPSTSGAVPPVENARKNGPGKADHRLSGCQGRRWGDLVVTKGDQYDVRENGEVRNLGSPVDLARRYYEEGADEITFLNITGFRDFPFKTCPCWRC
jgi:imidazole glycerol-phosphate synthase